jgi:hypothetical protein
LKEEKLQSMKKMIGEGETEGWNEGGRDKRNIRGTGEYEW